MEKLCGNIDDCGPEACGAGECQDMVDDYKCVCPEGYNEKDVEEEHTCARVMCGSPPVVAFASRPLSKAVFEDQIKYVCAVGHTLSGKSDGDKEYFFSGVGGGEKRIFVVRVWKGSNGSTMKGGGREYRSRMMQVVDTKAYG